MKSNFILGVVVVFIIGCSSARKLAIKDLSTEPLELPFKISILKITDNRDTLLSMNWDVPAIATKNRKWMGSPPLSEKNRADITQIIRLSENIDGVPINMEYRIIEGVCGLNADWKSVAEHAKFKAEIFVEIPSRNMTYTSYAEIHYDNPASNGTKNHALKLYNQAVKNVTHMALKQIRDGLKE